MSQDDVEAMIELRVERMVDHLDRMLLQGHLSQDDYNKAMADLDRWAEAKRAEAEKVQ